MEDKKIIKTAKKFLADGNVARARDLLLDEGYVKRLDPEIQKAFLRLIPASTTLRTMLAEVYKGIANRNPDIRLDAITKLTREFSRATLRDKARWMRDPRVSARALAALSKLVGKYFQDLRSLPIALAKLKDQKQNIRDSAISIIGCLRREDLLKYLVEPLEHGTEKDRTEVCGQIYGWSEAVTWDNALQGPLKWNGRSRRFWEGRMSMALRDPAVSVRKNAARALKQLGSSGSLPALQSAYRSEQDRDTRFYLDLAISSIKNKNHG
jgi:HEAT repeat protein